jgi:hypothetical protein
LDTDLELLEMEFGALWGTDRRGRLLESRERGAGRTPYLVIAVANDGQFAASGGDVPDGVAAQLQAAVATAPLLPPATQPASLVDCEQLLRDALGPLERSSGPSFLIPPGTTFPHTAEIHLSTGTSAETLRRFDPTGTGWSVDDWNQLLDGTLGPWAVAAADDRVISLCHCARRTDDAAEAGVSTSPDFRGQGHAAAVTAAWASLLAHSGRRLFYSTSADNLSSQRVAARLNLRPIGWTWKLTAPDAR